MRRKTTTGRVAAVCAAGAVVGLGAALGVSGCGSTSTPSATPALASSTVGTGGLPAPDGTTRPVGVVVPAGEGGGAFDTPRSLTVPAGWGVQVWARVPDARIEAWSPQGDLLVSQPDLGRVVELAPVARPVPEVVLSGLRLPQGLAFSTFDGHQVLYVGESDQIDRYAWGPGGAGVRTVVAGDLPDAAPAGDDDHRMKDIVVAPDGSVYFSVGSSTNAGPADRTADPQRAVIMAVRPDGSDLHVVERGVRNGEGLSVAPDGTVWTAVNNRDQVTDPDPGPDHGEVVGSYVDEHPADEVVPVVQGRDLGWPLCNPDQDLSTPAGSLADVPFADDAVTNPTGAALDCAALSPVEVGLPAHSAPVGLAFLEGSSIPAPWSGGAVVATHGSWDRQPPRAPALLWMAWDASTASLQAARTLVSGWQDAAGQRWGRPVDAVAGPDHALYVSDDVAGAVYCVVAP